MSHDESIINRDELVFAIDLTPEEVAKVAREVEEYRRDESRKPMEHPLPESPQIDISRVAIIIDGWDEPLLLPIEPTQDMVMLDALARLLRIAVLTGERITSVATEYGQELERRLVFERRLPDWSYNGIDAERASRLPTNIRRVLGPKK